jgi:phosphoribosylformimino-5-aminoimidazole carboxamide ribotide isomerase
MLVIPIIKISNGIATTIISSVGCSKLETCQPGDLAVILRGENFKAIHVAIEDTDLVSKKNSFNAVRDILLKVDIPLVVGAYLFNDDEITELFNLGCYRVVVNFPQEDTSGRVKNLMKIFSPSKIVIRLNILNHEPYDCTWNKIPMDVASVYAFLKELGIQRVLLSCYNEKENKTIDFDFLNEIFKSTKIRNTFIGGVNSLELLVKMMDYEKMGLDSIVVGKAIYENKFKCQMLWRENEKFLEDLGPTRRI